MSGELQPVQMVGATLHEQQVAGLEDNVAQRSVQRFAVALDREHGQAITGPEVEPVQRAADDVRAWWHDQLHKMRCPAIGELRFRLLQEIRARAGNAHVRDLADAGDVPDLALHHEHIVRLNHGVAGRHTDACAAAFNANHIEAVVLAESAFA
jgi:hypothetical protein